MRVSVVLSQASTGKAKLVLRERARNVSTAELRSEASEQHIHALWLYGDLKFLFAYNMDTPLCWTDVANDNVLLPDVDLSRTLGLGDEASETTGEPTKQVPDTTGEPTDQVPKTTAESVNKALNTTAEPVHQALNAIGEPVNHAVKKIDGSSAPPSQNNTGEATKKVENSKLFTASFLSSRAWNSMCGPNCANTKRIKQKDVAIAILEKENNTLRTSLEKVKELLQQNKRFEKEIKAVRNRLAKVEVERAHLRSQNAELLLRISPDAESAKPCTKRPRYELVEPPLSEIADDGNDNDSSHLEQLDIECSSDVICQQITDDDGFYRLEKSESM